MAEEICYLCSKPIPRGEKVSRDHVISKQFIEREQPRANGFDYGGFLPTHLACNNGFGGIAGESEIICQNALRLIQVFHSENSIELKARKDPSTSIFCIPNTEFKDFTKREMAYFGLTDTTNIPLSQWLNPDYYKDRKPMDPMEKPMNSALSVLAKNCAALLVKRHNVPRNNFWRIAAKPCISSLENADLSPILGVVKPFENGLKVYIKPFEGGDWFCAFQYKKICVWYFFSTTNRTFILNKWNTSLYKDQPACYYEGTDLIGMTGFNWVQHRLK